MKSSLVCGNIRKSCFPAIKAVGCALLAEATQLTSWLCLGPQRTVTLYPPKMPNLIPAELKMLLCALAVPCRSCEAKSNVVKEVLQVKKC